MTLEERIELHDQWLRSMESNQAQFAENLGRLEQHFAAYQKVFNEHMTNVAMQMSAFFTSLARLTTEAEERDRRNDAEHRQLQEEHRKFEHGLQDLRDLIERYIRFRGNGNVPAG